MIILKNKYIYIYIFIFLSSIFTLYSFGQPLINKNGIIQIWCGNVTSSCNSQDIADWYTPSHFLHGIVFFWIFLLIYLKFTKQKFNKNLNTFTNELLFYKIFLISLLVECFWEILENTPFIINKYREGTIAFDYSGDSVLNSGFDILFMSLGFLFAKKFGWKISVFAFIFLELFTLYFIKDNLTLNVIMLLYPLEIIKSWQMS
jgi:hypothetical protein